MTDFLIWIKWQALFLEAFIDLIIKKKLYPCLFLAFCLIYNHHKCKSNDLKGAGKG